VKFVAVIGYGLGLCVIVINLLTYNELPYLKNLIRQLRGFADEIYVCDDYSTDGTWEWLNEQKDLKLFQRKCNWKPGAQRNFLLSKTPYDCWVIKIDADEIPTFGFRFLIKDILNKASNPPELQRIFYYCFNLVEDLSHCHEDIGVQARIFWHSKKNNVRYVDEPHETILGDWDSECGVMKYEQGVVHLKLLDEDKVKVGRTDYVKHGIYQKDHIGEVLASKRVIPLPEHIGFDITSELINHLKLGVPCA